MSRAPRADPGWQDRALCAMSDSPNDWFPENGRPPARVRRTCAACPVRAECLRFAVENGERQGIWGGLSDEERRALPLGAPPPPAYCASGRHPRIPGGTGADGRCLACRREADAGRREAEIAASRIARRAARNGSASPQSGRSLAA
jgi:hypothetical protein